MAGQQQADARRLGLQAGVEPGLAEHHRVAAVLPGGIEQFVGRAAADGHRADRLLRLAHHLQPLDREELLQPLGKFAERERLGQPAPSARALAFRRAARSGAMPRRPSPAASRWLTPSRGRIERRVRTVHGDARGDQIQQQSADGRVGRSVASWPQTACG